VTKWVAEMLKVAQPKRMLLLVTALEEETATVVRLMARNQPAIMYQVLLYPDTRFNGKATPRG